MNEEREIHLRDYIRILRKRKSTIVIFFAIVFIMILVGSLTSTPVYSTATKVLIEKNEPNQILTNYTYVSYDPEFLETQSLIIKSIPVSKKVVHLLNLEKNFDTFMNQHTESGFILSAVKGWIKSMLPKISDLLGLNNSEASMQSADTLLRTKTKSEQLSEMISKSLMVKPVPDSRIVEITFSSPNPEIAAMVTNSVAKAYIEQILDMRMQSSGYSIGWMTRKADEERLKLEQSEQSLQKYMKDHDIVTIEDRITILPQKLAEVSSELTRAQTRRKEAETVYNQVMSVIRNKGDLQTLPMISENQALQAMNLEIRKARQQILEISKKYGPKHPLMKSALAEIDSLNANRDREIERIVASIKNEYDLARATEETLDQLLTCTKSDTADLNERFIQYGILKRDVETNRNLYNALVSKIKEQSVTDQIRTVDVWVVEDAKIPEFPSKPNKPRNLLLGIILGLFGGIGLAFFLEYLDNTIKLPEDVEDRLGLPVLGMVPESEGLPENGAAPPVPIDMDTPIGESYKALRSAIQLSSQAEPPKALLITSVLPREGKTTTAIHLAMAMSQLDRKVLLMDADLRRPRISNFFAIDNAKGLSTYLAGVTDMKIAHKDVRRNLDVIPSGPCPPNPSELLASERYKTLIKLLKEKYDTVIIDSPPLLSVSDALPISKLADGTIVIVRSAETTWDAFEKGIKKLDDIQAKLAGIVINAVNIRTSGYGYYSQYGYYETDGTAR